MPHRVLYFLIVLFLATSMVPSHGAWPELGIPLPPSNLDQGQVVSLPDGQGGLFVAWAEIVSGVGGTTQAIKMQRIDPDGNALWGTLGIVVKTPVQRVVARLRIESDGLGGALLAWTEQQAINGADPLVYAQRVSSAGIVLWQSSGVRPQAGTAIQRNIVVTRDGTGGAVVAWQDLRSGSPEVYANRISSTGSVLWTITGRRVATGLGTVADLHILDYGTGGALVYWNAGTSIQQQQLDGSGNAIFASPATLALATRDVLQKLTVRRAPSGRVRIVYQDRNSFDILVFVGGFDALGNDEWGGLELIANSSAELNEATLDLAIDPASQDLLVAWRWFADEEVRYQRLTSAGIARYPFPGRSIDNAAGSLVLVTADTSGGAIITWQRDLGALGQVIAQRVDPSGLFRWGPTGRQVGTALGGRFPRAQVADPAGGAYVLMSAGSPADAFIQRIEPEHGVHGRPEPTIATAADVPGDQGGAIHVAWDRSPLDVDPQADVSYYSVWRATHVLARGAHVVDLEDFEPDVAGPVLRRAANGYYWEYVGQQIATQWPGYAFTVPTLADSTSVDDALTYVQVVAHTVDGFTFASAADSARSTDDLAPAAPSPLSASRTGTDPVTLEWSAPAASDLRDFRVYRALGDDVAIEPANLFATTSDSVLVDTDALPAQSYAYRVIAVDVHENASPSSNLARVESSATSAPAGTVVSLRLDGSHPNPFTGRTLVRFAVPRATDVTIDVFDLAGRRVRSIEARAEEGSNAVAFDGRDDGGRMLASGTYMYRVRAQGEARSGRFVLLR